MSVEPFGFCGDGQLQQLEYLISNHVPSLGSRDAFHLFFHHIEGKGIVLS